MFYLACTVFKEIFSTFLVPDRVFWKDTAKEIILPTLTGQMGVLTNHIPLLTGLDTGLIMIRKPSSNDWIYVVVMGGFALVNDNKVTILVNEAELGSVRIGNVFIFILFNNFFKITISN